ncbi:leucine-rich repeat protein [Artemisia annua]|uniref:Leucine-rich repeat protein n=1 Tax=Artemisia annua TaxID=35608 RepID=A0A2U1QCT4_ARTAN|nr:leucine-rich repeat protein [Artemisia annua]
MELIFMLNVGSAYDTMRKCYKPYPANLTKHVGSMETEEMFWMPGFEELHTTNMLLRQHKAKRRLKVAGIKKFPMERLEYTSWKEDPAVENDAETIVNPSKLKDSGVVGGQREFQTEVEMISLAVHRNLPNLYAIFFPRWRIVATHAKKFLKHIGQKVLKYGSTVNWLLAGLLIRQEDASDVVP